MQSTVISVVALALQNIQTQKFLIARRGPDQSGAGEWEFPGGKVESGEFQYQALQREIEEELGIHLDLQRLYFIKSVEHAYPNKTIQLHLWHYRISEEPELTLVDHDQIDWLSVDELKNSQLSQGDRKLLKSIY